MDDVKPPTLSDLLMPYLVDECELIATHHVQFWTFWYQAAPAWICDVHDDWVNVHWGPKIKATDPEFMTKFKNAIEYALEIASGK